MRPARRQHRATHTPPKPAAVKHYLACLQLLHAGTVATPEQAAAIERTAQQAPYRGKRQGELKI